MPVLKDEVKLSEQISADSLMYMIKIINLSEKDMLKEFMKFTLKLLGYKNFSS